MVEGSRGLGTLDHDKIVVLALEAKSEKFAAPARSNLPSIW
jgi:hypothetical protein